MRGEVKLGLVVGFIFLVRFIWVQSRRSGGGRWVGSSVRMPQSIIGRISDLGIYLGVAASVVSGLLVAYVRPGAELTHAGRGFFTSSPSLNAAIDAHAFVSDALEWLCAFHVAYSLWHWLIKRTQWGRIAGAWVERAASNAGRVGSSYLRGKTFRV
jgi:cytochrome b561